MEKMQVSEKLEKKLHSIGIDITLIDSLVKFLDAAMSDDLDITDVDKANLTIVLKRIVKIIKSKYDSVEQLINI